MYSFSLKKKKEISFSDTFYPIFFISFFLIVIPILLSLVMSEEQYYWSTLFLFFSILVLVFFFMSLPSSIYPYEDDEFSKTISYSLFIIDIILYSGLFLLFLYLIKSPDNVEFIILWKKRAVIVFMLLASLALLKHLVKHSYKKTSIFFCFFSFLCTSFTIIINIYNIQIENVTFLNLGLLIIDIRYVIFGFTLLILAIYILVVTSLDVIKKLNSGSINSKLMQEEEFEEGSISSANIIDIISIQILKAGQRFYNIVVIRLYNFSIYLAEIWSSFKLQIILFFQSITTKAMIITAKSSFALCILSVIPLIVYPLSKSLSLNLLQPNINSVLQIVIYGFMLFFCSYFFKIVIYFGLKVDKFYSKQKPNLALMILGEHISYTLILGIFFVLSSLLITSLVVLWHFFLPNYYLSVFDSFKTINYPTIVGIVNYTVLSIIYLLYRYYHKAKFTIEN